MVGDRRSHCGTVRESSQSVGHELDWSPLAAEIVGERVVGAIHSPRLHEVAGDDRDWARSAGFTHAGYFRLDSEVSASCASATPAEIASPGL